MDNILSFKKGMKDGIPIMLGYFAVSFALGIAAAKINMNSIQAFIMSAGMMASAGEFASIELLKTNAGIVEIIATCLIVNLRYFLMSCSLSQKPMSVLNNKHRLCLAYCITDEIFALSIHTVLLPCPFSDGLSELFAELFLVILCRKLL